jgi:hypothetical protein
MTPNTQAPIDGAAHFVVTTPTGQRFAILQEAKSSAGFAPPGGYVDALEPESAPREVR